MEELLPMGSQHIGQRPRPPDLPVGAATEGFLTASLPTSLFALMPPLPLLSSLLLCH